MMKNFIREGKWAKMNRIDELIREYCPDGVEIRYLEDCCNLLDKKRKPITKAFRDNPPAFRLDKINERAP